MTTTLRTAVVLAGASLLIAASTSAASAASASPPPPVSGCPAAAQLIDVATFFDLGYRAPTAVDSAGNGDGVVCGIAIQPQAAEQRFGTAGCYAKLGCFLFSDNTLTPRH